MNIMSNQENETVSVSFKVLKDSLGNKVYPGDVLLQYGTGWRKGHYALRLWEISYPFDGDGIEYDLSGEPHKFFWCSLSSSIKVNFDDFPAEFKYSFYHGLSNLYSKIEKGTLKKLIENSDWAERIVNPSDVELYNQKKNLKIESIKDIKHNIDLLLGPGVTPGEVVTKIFTIAGVSAAPLINGEMAFAVLEDTFKYKAILEKIKESI